MSDVRDPSTDASAPGATPPAPMGLLLIDKPVGPTSMDVCRWVRRRLVLAGAPKRVKVGHAGTLDPLASGLLVVLVGRATRLCEALMADTKVYEATIDLSATSSTDDAEGEKTPASPPGGAPPDRAAFAAACAGMVGVISQRPPAFSAIKVGGRRAYDLARAGRAPALAARPVRIDAIQVLGYAWPVASVRVTCGKGTYIRALARDLGAALGVGGYLTALRRTRSGRAEVSAARPLEGLPPRLTQGDLLDPALLTSP